MGFGLPGAIGAYYGSNGKSIVCIAGDGGIQMNIQELQTIIHNKLPIKIFVLNNDGYGIIKQFQELYLGGRYEATIPSKGVTNPNFKKISKAFNINYNLIKNHNDLKYIKKAEKLIKNQGRILVRKSGTESKIRIMGEGINKKLLLNCLEIIRKKIK